MPETPAPVTPGRGRRTTVLVVAALAVLAADQATKAWVLHSLDPLRRPSLFGGFLTLHVVRNPGAAFSFATGTTWVFTLVALAVVVAIVRISRRLRSWTWTVTLGLLLGGALGNLCDRLFRSPGVARGHVVDFIDYHGWFVGNVADVAIVTGAILVVVLAALGITVDGSRIGTGAHERVDPDD
jgi:signal peptidase II